MGHTQKRMMQITMMATMAPASPLMASSKQVLEPSLEGWHAFGSEVTLVLVTLARAPPLALSLALKLELLRKVVSVLVAVEAFSFLMLTLKETSTPLEARFLSFNSIINVMDTSLAEHEDESRAAPVAGGHENL